MGQVLTTTVLEPLPMSIGQRALWFEQQAHPQSNAYNLGACLRMEQSIDAATLDRALQRAAARHPMLRARFDLIDGEACRWYVHEHPPCMVLSDHAADSGNALRSVEDFVLAPYRLAQEPSFRFGLVPLAHGCLLAIGCHHIAADLHCLARLVEELGAAEDGRSPPPAAYEEFAHAQCELLASPRSAAAGAFWREQLARVPAIAHLGELESGVPAPGSPGGRIDVRIPPALGHAVHGLARRSNVSAFNVLLTSFQALLAKRAGRDAVLVGVPFANRWDERFDRTVGYFVNLLPLAFTLDRATPFALALASNARNVQAGLRRGDYPYARMAEQSPVLQAGALEASFTFQKTAAGLDADRTRLALGLPGGRLQVLGSTGELVTLREPMSQFPFGLTMGPVADTFEGALQFDPSRIAFATARQFLQDWVELLTACCEKPDAPLGELLDRADNGRPGGPATTLLQAVETCLQAHAGRTALMQAEQRVSYRELDERSRRVAAWLRARGVQPGDRVGVVGNGSIDTVVALLGVLRRGAAFVPFDDSLPAQRLQDLQRAAGVVETLGPAPADTSHDEHPIVQLHPAAPAWLMFTSGTTGSPKAAVVPQSAALAHARAIAQRLALEPGDKVLQFASLSFDEHAEEIFPTLLAGACIVCAPAIRYEPPQRLVVSVREHDISVLHLPTSWWHLWCDELALAPHAVPPTLRLVNVGGEQPSTARLATWRRCAPGVRWVNTYGLTEAAVTSLVYEPGESRPDVVPAGTPLPGTRVRIVDRQGRDVMAGDAGELILGGAGVGLGYLGDPPSGMGRFFTAHGVRWLRTGDLARAVDNQVVIEGRIDRAVKVRGARVDLAAGEAALAEHPSVLEAVIDKDGAGGLVAWIVLRGDAVLSPADAQALVQPHLPQGVPIRVRGLDEIPRTAGRKPDYARLEAIASGMATPVSSVYEARGTEARVAALFARLLNREDVDPASSFFELGGHSLLAMRAVAALRRELGIDLTIAEFLAEPTARGVAAARPMQAPRPCSPADPLPGRQYPLSAAQRRVVALRGLVPEPLLRARCLLRLRGALDMARLRRAWRDTLLAHPLLAARVGPEGNLEVADAADLPGVRLVHLDAPPSLTRRWMLAHADRAAAEAPGGLGATLLQLSEREHLLIVDVPLETVDGDAVPLVLQSFQDALASGASPGGASYARFVQAERDWLASAACVAARAYWSASLKGAPAPTSIARMHSSTRTDSLRVRCTLPPRVARTVGALAAARGSSPFAVLLAAFLVLLARWSGERDLLLGVPVSLRDRLGVPDACGPTLNPLPWLFTMQPDERFGELLARVQAQLARALDHAPLPYEEIAAPCPSLRGEPLPIQFVGQGTGPTQRLDAVDAVEHPGAREGHCPACLLVGVRPGLDGIGIDLEWRIDALATREALELLRSYRLLVAGLAADPSQVAGAVRPLPMSRLRAVMAVAPGAAPSGAPMLLHAGLVATARAHPGRIALRCGDRHVDYATLDAWSDAHARRLVAAGVRPGDRVVIVSRLGIDEVVAACAVLKAGAAYVPIPHALPATQAIALALRAQARVATGDPALAPAWLQDAGCSFSALAPQDVGGSSPDLPHGDAAALAYVLFTSGSTGEAKGVAVSHACAMMTVQDVVARFAIGSGDVLYRQAALGFDLSVFDLFGAFAAGATLALPPGGPTGDAFAWARDIRRYGVTVWNSVPAALDMVLVAAGREGLPSLRRVLASGDWIALDLAARLQAASPHARFIGLGGATEASIWSCFQEVRSVDPAWSSIPYGRALGGQSLFIADGHGWPLPRGVVGEICIGGGALAQGYWGDPKRTAQSFPQHAASGQRYYRTGDIGREMPDGRVEFLGRLDGQLKIRGTRVDLREIERVLGAWPGVHRVLVGGVAGVGGHGRSVEALVAHVQPESGAVVDLESLRGYAGRQLAPHSRPSAYRIIDAVPLTDNGKVDWQALGQAPLADPVASAASATTGTRAEQLAAIWGALLPGAPSGPEDDFFDVGGHSLLAVRLLARVRGETGHEVPLAAWLERPTLARLALLVDQGPEPASAMARNGRELHPYVRLASDIQFCALRQAPGTIVVTGGTGLIGSRVVVQLLRRTDAEIVLIDRNPQRVTPLHERVGVSAAARGRLRTVRGDLALPRFGMSEAVFESIAAAAGLVVHVGAQVNLMASYEALQAANVGGTHEAIRLAALAGAPLCHISSVGVAAYGAGKLVMEDEPLEEDGLLLSGYCQTKWVAEQLVRSAMARGQRALIVRPGLTVAPERDPAQRDLLGSVLALSRAVGCLPELDMPVDLVDADYAAAAIAHLALQQEALGRTFHLTHPEPMPLGAVHHSLGAELPVRPWAEWRARVTAALPGLGDPQLAALGAVVVQHDEAAITPATFDTRNTLDMLYAIGIRCAAVEAMAQAVWSRLA